MASQVWNLIGDRLPTVEEFVNDTDNGWGRSQLRRMDKLLGDAKINRSRSEPVCPRLSQVD